MVQRSTKVGAAVAAALMMLGAGCSSSTKSSNGPSSATGSRTYTVGVIADLTGGGSNTAGSYPLGIKAGVGVAAKEGYHIKYVEADTTSTPTGALAAAKRLVEQDHVFAVFMTSVVGFGAASYLASHNIPVVGAAVDGPEWISDKNMFSVLGYEDYTKVNTTMAQFLKMRGVTDVASVGYGIEPSSADVAKGTAIAARHEGMKVGYLNANFPLGSTNVAPMVLAMKNAGVNGLVTGILTNSTFAIIKGLEQQGVSLKAAIPPTGYGGDLVKGGPGAKQEAQGVYFISGMEPVEMNTPATRRLQSALRTYAGVTSEPTFSEYQGYATVDAFVTGLKAAGSNPTPASFTSAMLGITHYDAAGLYGSHSIGFSMAQRGKYAGADNCIWFTQYKGSSFHLIQGADPLCGQTLAGARVSGS